MARQNLTATRIKPETAELLTMRVLRRERLSPHFARVTLGQNDVESFTPMGFDQWFRLFIPMAEGSLDRLPNKLNALAYARFLTIAKTKPAGAAQLLRPRVPARRPRRTGARRRLRPARLRRGRDRGPGRDLGAALRAGRRRRDPRRGHRLQPGTRPRALPARRRRDRPAA